jgi:hypothetical protein
MVVNCEHVWKEISNYLDGEIDADLRSAMEAHFAQCKHCTAVLDGARNVVQLYGDDRLFELPAGFSRRLQRRFAGESGSPSFAGLHSFWMLAVAAVALIAGAVALGNSSVFVRTDARSRLAQPAYKIPPDLKVVASSEGRLFHVPGCRYLHNKIGESPETMTASQAMREGYAPCPRCLRRYLSAAVECPRPAPNSDASEVQLDARTRFLSEHDSSGQGSYVGFAWANAASGRGIARMTKVRTKAIATENSGSYQGIASAMASQRPKEPPL